MFGRNTVSIPKQFSREEILSKFDELIDEVFKLDKTLSIKIDEGYVKVKVVFNERQEQTLTFPVSLAFEAGILTANYNPGTRLLSRLNTDVMKRSALRLGQVVVGKRDFYFMSTSFLFILGGRIFFHHKPKDLRKLLEAVGDSTIFPASDYHIPRRHIAVEKLIMLCHNSYKRSDAPLLEWAITESSWYFQEYPFITDYFKKFGIITIDKLLELSDHLTDASAEVAESYTILLALFRPE